MDAAVKMGAEDQHVVVDLITLSQLSSAGQQPLDVPQTVQLVFLIVVGGDEPFQLGQVDGSAGGQA